MIALFIFPSLASTVNVVGRIRIAWRRAWRVLFCVFLNLFYFLSHFLLLDLLYLLSSDQSYLFLLVDLLHLLSPKESYLLDDESKNYGSDYRSSVTCYFPLRFDDSIGHVSSLVYGIFVPIGVKSNCDVVALALFLPIGVEFKSSRLSKYFGAQSTDFPSKLQDQFFSHSPGLALSHSFRPL